MLLRIIAKVLILALLLAAATLAETLENQIDGYLLGTCNAHVLERVGELGPKLRRTFRRRDNVEVLMSPDGSLSFWLDSGQVVAIKGTMAIFRGKQVEAGRAEEYYQKQLGVPDEVRTSQGDYDIATSKRFYYRDGRDTLMILLKENPRTGKPGLLGSSLYLYEDKWL